MNISLIYHINSNYETLKQSLKSIFDQTCQDFEFVLIDDNSTEQVKNCINSFSFNKLKKFTYVNSNQKLGHSFSFNVGLDNAKGKYVYYLGSNVTLEKDFIKKMNLVIEKSESPDFIVLTNSGKEKNSIKTYKTVNKNLFKILKPSIKDKVFKTSFLKKNKIYFENFQYYPILYLYKCLNVMESVVCVDDHLVDFSPNRKYTYNLYDTFEQSDYLMAHKSEFNFLKTKENKDLYEFMIIYSIIYTFLYKIDHTYWSKTNLHSPKIIGKALHFSNKWLSANIPNWRENPILVNNELDLDSKTIDYLKNFRFKLLYVHRKIR